VHQQLEDRLHLRRIVRRRLAPVEHHGTLAKPPAARREPGDVRVPAYYPDTPVIRRSLARFVTDANPAVGIAAATWLLRFKVGVAAADDPPAPNH
jgi:hypothetical protein